MDSKNDTWKDRHELVPYAYGLNVIHMLTVQTVAHGEYLKLSAEKREEIEKLMKNYQWKKSKNGAASVIEAICDVLNPDHENGWLNNLLDSCCHRNSFDGDFGLNHVFAVIFLPILISTVIGQKKYGVDIRGRFDEAWGERHSLFQILEIHREILKWHETKGATEVIPIYRFGKDFVEKATVETGHSKSTEDSVVNYKNVQRNYGRA